MLSAFHNVFKTRKKLTIEAARTDETAMLSNIHRQGFQRGWSDGELTALLSQRAYHCLVAHWSGKEGAPPSGFVLYRQVLEEAEIISVAVAKNSRRKGIAAALMDETIRQLQMNRVNNLFLDVDEHNIAALALYKKFGFTEINRRRSYYGKGHGKQNNESAALVMCLDLG